MEETKKISIANILMTSNTCNTSRTLFLWKNAVDFDTREVMNKEDLATSSKDYEHDEIDDDMWGERWPSFLRGGKVWIREYSWAFTNSFKHLHLLIPFEGKAGRFPKFASFEFGNWYCWSRKYMVLSISTVHSNIKKETDARLKINPC